MRLFAYLAIYGSLSSAQKDKKGESKTIDLRAGNGKEKSKQKAPVPERVAAPRPLLTKEQMIEQAMAKMEFGAAPQIDFNENFAKFALTNQFPPAVMEHKMMEEYARRNELRKKTEEKNAYLQQLRRENNTKKLSCLTCSSQSYEGCYQTGLVKECSAGEESCFLETRYLGHSVIHVTSGCQQKIACINNMKQNFWDIDGNGINLEDAEKHDCKVFSSGQGNSSVCRNCCFDNNCTQDWQPNSFDEWRIMPKTPQMREMMVFDQFKNPPEHWMKAAENRRIEYFTNIADMNAPPSKKGKKKAKEGEENAKKGANGVINLRATPRTTQRPTTRRPATTRKPTTAAHWAQKVTTTRKPATKKPTTRAPVRAQFGNTLGSRLEGRPAGAQKQQQQQPNMQRMMAMRQARMKAAAAAKTTQKPKVLKTTPKPTKTKQITDDDFLNLLDILGKKETKKTENNQMRFSLNVNENGEVNQMYGKDAEKKNTNVASRLGKPVNSAPVKGSHVINRNQFVQKDEVEKSKFGPASTKQAPTKAPAPAAPTKPGPWAHLPPWKQRQLKAARARQMAARQNAGGAKPTQKPAIKATPKPVARKPVQPVRKPGQPMRRPGQPGPPMRPRGQPMRKPIQKAPLRRTPVRAPVPSGKKAKTTKPSAARPQMMKFSQWAEPTDAKLEEGEIIQINSDVSDDQFAAMIAGMDTKSEDVDFDSLIDDIQNEFTDATFSGPDPRYRMTDEEFDDFVSQLS